MKFRELLNETEEAIETKPLRPIKEKFKEDVLGEVNELNEKDMFPTLSLGQFVKASEEENETESDELDEKIDDVATKKLDTDKFRKDALAGKDKMSREKDSPKPSHWLLHKSAFFKWAKKKIFDDKKGKYTWKSEKGEELTDEEMKQLLSKRPTELLVQNAKMARSNDIIYNISLPAYQGMYYDKDANELRVVTTCPHAGDCKIGCYAMGANFIMFAPPSIKFAQMMTFLMNDEKEFGDMIIKELEKAQKDNKGSRIVMRWHDSGDFFSKKYITDVAFRVAKATPDVFHYAYTKSVPEVKEVMGSKPDNFDFRFSLGGDKDTDVDTKKERHAIIVPREVFSDLPDKKTHEYTAEKVVELKKRIAEKYKIDVDTIKTYNEIMKMKEGDKPEWNVIYMEEEGKGHKIGDEPTQRKDVIGVYLLKHA